MNQSLTNKKQFSKKNHQKNFTFIGFSTPVRIIIEFYSKTLLYTCILIQILHCYDMDGETG